MSIRFCDRLQNASIAIGLGILLATAASGKAAAFFYGATGGSQPGEFYTINGSDGSVNSDVGPLVDGSGNHYSITGLAIQPSSGNLFGITATQSPTASATLVRINPANARVTVIGALGQLFGDITFDISSGTLYGAAAAGGDFYTINPSNGSATLVGTSGISGSSGHGLAGNSAGTLFTTPDGSGGSLWTYNKTTGAATSVASLSGAPSGVSTINALAFSGGTLYGIGGSQGGATHLLSINTTSGEITDFGVSPNNLDALTPVPEPSTYAMVFGIGLAGFAIIRRRFSRQESSLS